jgi:hypothetical protein
MKINKRAIWQEVNNLGILCPANDEQVLEICKKDIPKGKKFKILNYSDFPTDKTWCDAWEYDIENDFDGVGENDDYN